MWAPFSWTPPQLLVLLPLLLHQRPEPSIGQAKLQEKQQGRNLSKLWAETNSLLVIVMALILVKVTERSVRNNQIREIRGLYNITLPPLKKKMHHRCMAGKVGIPLPGQALTPGQLDASHFTGVLGMKLPTGPGSAATATRHFAGRGCCRWHHGSVTQAAEQGHTGASHNSFCTQPELIVNLLCTLTLFWTVVLLFYPLWIHCMCSRFKINSLWQVR